MTTPYTGPTTREGLMGVLKDRLEHIAYYEWKTVRRKDGMTVGDQFSDMTGTAEDCLDLIKNFEKHNGTV